MSKRRFGVTILVTLVLALSLVCSTVPQTSDPVPLIISPGTDGIATVTPAPEYNVSITPPIVVDANTTFTDVVRLECPAGYNDTIGIANLTLNSSQIKELQIFVNYSNQKIILTHYQDGDIIQNNTFKLHPETEAIMGITIIPTPTVINAGPIDPIYYNIFCSYEVTLVHDVAVTAVVPVKPCSTVPGAGHPIDYAFPTWGDNPLNITVTVNNKGTGSATFDVNASYVNATGSYLIGTQGITLGEGATENVTFSWNVSAVALGIYNITAEAVLEGDTYPDDNSLTYSRVKIKLPADANGDAIVDVSDFAALGKSWFKECGDSGYDPTVDFNCDCFIDVSDFATLGKWWFKTTDAYTAED